jgi:uncharacterized protein
MGAMQPRHQMDRNRFEIQIDDITAHLDYIDCGSTLVITHTFVPQALRGRGLAGILTQSALEFARKERKKIDPQCGYVASFLAEHPEYADLREF